MARKLPLEFHFLGAAHHPLASRPDGSLISYGRYQDDQLQELLQQVRPHVAWFPAQCPETYSYTLSACLEAALPIIAPNLGAFPERLVGREWSWIRDWQQKPEDWNNFFAVLMHEHFIPLRPPAPLTGSPPARTFSYVHDYLSPVVARHAAESIMRDKTIRIK